MQAQMIRVAGTYVLGPPMCMPLTTTLTISSAMIVDASASRPAIATDGWRIRTLIARNWTTRWMTQNSSVASTSAVALTEKLLSTAVQSSRPIAMPASEKPSLIAHLRTTA